MERRGAEGELALARPCCRRARPVPHHGIGSHRTGDILEILLAQIGELDLDLAADLIVGRRRDADATGFCDALKPRRDVDAVPKNIVRLDNYVADIDADTEGNTLVFRITDCKFIECAF